MELTAKVILEGTRLTGETDLASALHEHPCLVGHRRYRHHSPLIPVLPVFDFDVARHTADDVAGRLGERGLPTL
ncbi:hypothetical protein [Lentzea sp. NPDC060358]|uniref:hypothetical protein n=1 Tax=Lentzea sp. NPDC060358 TaxID=3347103 RepID=UPI00366A501A